MQSTFKKSRIELLEWIFKNSINIYAKNFKKNKASWNISKQELAQYTNGSLGNELLKFLNKNKLTIISKSEHHDCYHAITGYQANVKDEIALQYLCFANGKRTVNLFLIIFVGTLLLPDYLGFYLKSYRIGKNANPFHQLDFKKLLATNLKDIQSIIFSKKSIISSYKNKTICIKTV